MAGYLFTAVKAQGRTLIKGAPLTISFSADGTGSIGLKAGCNSMGGTPVYGEGTIVIPQLISTMMACADPDGGSTIMEQERWYKTWFTDGVDFAWDGKQLVVKGGDVTVTFDRTGPAAGSSTGSPTGSTVRPTDDATVSVEIIPGTETPPTTPSPETKPAVPAPVATPSPLDGFTPAPAKTRDPGDQVGPPPVPEN